MMLNYNLVRLHMALKFGGLAKTPAMKAGLAAKRISFREVFTDFLFSLFADLPRKCRLGFVQSCFASRRVISISTALA